MDNEQTKETEAPSPVIVTIVTILALLAIGGAGYLFVTNIHELSMIMLGQMRSGYEAFLYQHLQAHP